MVALWMSSPENPKNITRVKKWTPCNDFQCIHQLFRVRPGNLPFPRSIIATFMCVYDFTDDGRHLSKTNANICNVWILSLQMVVIISQSPAELSKKEIQLRKVTMKQFPITWKLDVKKFKYRFWQMTTFNKWVASK